MKEGTDRKLQRQDGHLGSHNCYNPTPFPHFTWGVVDAATRFPNHPRKSGETFAGTMDTNMASLTERDEGYE